MKFMASGSQFRSSFYAVVAICITVALHAQTPASVLPAALPQAAATSPKVTYANGQLTITAKDASLGDILRAVSTKTGAVIEFPADRAQEHLFAVAGPGPVRDVLSSLLNGSHFNYVMVASPTDPSILQRMILTSAEQSTTQNQEPVPTAADAPLVPRPAQALQPLPASVMQEAEQMELEVPKEPLSPDAVEALMKQRKEARRLQHEQEAAAAGTTSAQ